MNIISNQALCELRFIFSQRHSPSGTRHLLWGSSITVRHITLSRTPLEHWSARIPGSVRPQVHALSRATTGIGLLRYRL